MTPKHTKGTPKRAPASVFVATTIVVFFLSLSAADSIGFVPDYIDGSTTLTTGGSDSLTTSGSDSFTTGGSTPNTDSVQAASTDSASGDSVALSSLPQLGEGATTAAPKIVVLPTHITIQSVGIDLPVQNPSTTDVDTLDNLLKQGPARFSPSASLGTAGNMIIFAHSSHLPSVMIHNKMYQAFNQIPNVQKGASVAITGSDGKTYLYSVDSVVKADTNDGTTIPLVVSDGAKLTLVTCDTLTGKSARFILTASFVGTDVF
jgi:LPXTG-site transpeptidase (sortase) family protein